MRGLAIAVASVLLLALGACRHKKTAVVRQALGPGHAAAGAQPEDFEQAVHRAMVAGDRLTVWYSMSRATQAAMLKEVAPVVHEMDASPDDKVEIMAGDLGLTVVALRALPAEELSVALMLRASTPEERAALTDEKVSAVELPTPDHAVVTTVASGETRKKHVIREDGAWRSDYTREIAEVAAPPAAKP